MATIRFFEKLPTIRQLKSLLIEEALKRTRGDMDKAAAILDVPKRFILFYLQKNLKQGK